MNILRIKRKSKVNIKRYILLIFSLIMTTFAWFTFSKILNSGMLIHIDSWNLDFYIDEDLTQLIYHYTNWLVFKIT